MNTDKPKRTYHRRFTNADEIIKKIDSLKDKALASMQRAQLLEGEAAMMELPQAELLAMAKKKREESATLRKQADKCIYTLIPGLSQKLAQIRTPLLPGIGGDESIPQRLSV